MPTIGINHKFKVNGTKGVSFRKKSVNFGDGYKQRSKEGINTIQESWNITFFNERKDEREVLEAILKLSQGVDAIEWKSPHSSVLQDWLVESYELQEFSDVYSEITCTFTLLNEP